MDYYEELGIHRDASTGEIREAYKLAARLLHPDMQRDPRLKALAECQMKRLTDLAAILLNPRERARYDAGLANVARTGRLTLLAQTSGSELLQTVVRHWFWVLLGTITAGMGAWYGLARGPDVLPGFAAAQSASVPPAPVVTRSERTAAKKRPAKAAGITRARDVEVTAPLSGMVVEEPPPGAAATAPTLVETAPAEAVRVEQRGAPPVQETWPADTAQSGGGSRFAGEWLYATDGREEDRTGMYPARYVEFRLRQESGTLAGAYRAVHRLLDKAISPEVIFRVRGESPEGDNGKLQWESSAGAKGELELTLQAPNQLQVKWWTTQFGRQEALSSGMAVLMRLKKP